MSILVKTTPATKPKSQDVQRIAVFYAGVLAILATCQLFTFDHFFELTASFGLPGGLRYSYFLTSVLVVTEVFALPFLLRMPLSPAFRWVSMVCGWLVSLIWLEISIWLVTTEPIVENVGFLGTVVDVMPGWWAVFISAAFGILAAWASWGMWPRRQRKQLSK